MVFSADDGWDPPRQALAVEPMTAPPDAFRSGRDLVTLAPAGRAGRRGLSLLGDPGARVTRAAVRASSIRSWRTATLRPVAVGGLDRQRLAAGAVGQVEDRERRARSACARPAPRPTRRSGGGSR